MSLSPALKKKLLPAVLVVAVAAAAWWSWSNLRSDGLDDVRVHAEREAVLATLRETGFNVSECARRLRVSRVTVYRLCRKHQLELESLRV